MKLEVFLYVKRQYAKLEMFIFKHLNILILIRLFGVSHCRQVKTPFCHKYSKTSTLSPETLHELCECK